MSSRRRRRRRQRRRRRILVVTGVLLLMVLLENLPGRYPIEDAQDEFPLDRWEGILLQAVEQAELATTLRFDRRTRHRISRNAELIVPAGTTLAATATLRPFQEGDEVIARPDTALLTADRPLIFIYRGVTVARAKRLEMQTDAETPTLNAIGRYRLLSALLTAHRYHRQKAVRRDYPPPDFAYIDFSARFRPDHPAYLLQEHAVRTGREPGRLDIYGGTYSRGRWTGGELALSIHLGDPEPWLNEILTTLVPNRFELGNLFEVRLKGIQDIRFSPNQVDLRVDGRLTSANSERVENVIHPSFAADLSIGFDLPRDVPLLQGSARIYLKNIRSLDFNKSNPLFDKSLRSLARRYREEASAEIDFAEEFSELRDFPGNILIRNLELNGNTDGGPHLHLQATLQSPE